MAHVIRKIEAAQAFDELSILEIKRDKSIDENQIKLFKAQINILTDEIKQSLGSDLMKEIYYSHFYISLLNANLDIFLSVDRYKSSEPAQLNMKRIDAKRKLQENFFMKALEEIKIL